MRRPFRSNVGSIHFCSSPPPAKRLVNRFERGAAPRESGVIEAPRNEGWRLGFVFLRHLVQVDCVTVKFTSATVMSEVLANVSDSIYMSHVAMGLNGSLEVVEMVKLIPQERVADRQHRTSCTRATNWSTTSTTSPVIKYIAPASATPVIDFVALAPAIKDDEPAPVNEYVEPEPAATYATAAIEYASPTPAVTRDAPASAPTVSRDDSAPVWSRT